MIDTVLFDIGTVLVEFQWQQYLCRMVADPKERQMIDDAMFQSGLWDEVDRGVWTEEEVLDAFFARVPQYREDIQRIYDNIGTSLIKNAYADNWIDEMKARGLRVLFLSNYARYIIDKVPESFTFLEKMDGGVFSCDVHLLKPDPAIYQTCLEQYQLTAESCLFIDDRKDNCEAAQKFGIHTVHFQTFEQAHADAQRLLEQA